VRIRPGGAPIAIPFSIRRAGVAVTLLPADSDDTSDDELVLSARASAAAFSMLYERYASPVYVYVYSRVGNPDDAADLTQQVFLDALHGIRRFRGNGRQFRAWLFRIARNKVIDSYRRARNTVAWDTLPPEWEPVSDEDIESRILQHEALDRLRTLVDGLNPNERDLLVLRFTIGLSTREIAEIVQKSEAATKQQLFRIVRTLKERYHASSA
jgi:RNA polymerase sigma-70 factor (ECF subfamily)